MISHPSTLKPRLSCGPRPGVGCVALPLPLVRSSSFNRSEPPLVWSSACRQSEDYGVLEPRKGGIPNVIVALIAFLLCVSFTATADTVTATNVASAAPVVTPAAAPAVSAYSAASTTTAGLPDTGASVIRVFGALILVISLFLGGVWLFRNWQRFAVQKGGGAKLNLIEVKSLGQRQALYVVGYQQQRMLLASTPAGVTLVSHLPAADETVAAEAAPNLSFAEAFQHVLSRKQ